MKKQFAVIGLGRFGTSVATTLAQLGYDVLAVDSDEARVEELAEVATHAVQADATDIEVLKQLGIRNFDVVVVSIGHNMEASILVTLILKEMGVKQVIAKAGSELHSRVLKRVGADRVVFPERDMGARVAHNLVASNIIDYIELAPNYSLLEITPPCEMFDKTIRELNLRTDYGINVLAIKRGNEIKVSPGADDVIKKGDILVVVGENGDLKQLEEE